MDDPKTLNRFSSGGLVAEITHRNSTISQADAKLAVARVFDALNACMERDEKVRVGGFGTFERKYQAGRTLNHIRTGEPITTAGKHVVKFKPSATKA